MKHSIALKIFALAVGILVLMMIVSIMNSVAVIKLGQNVQAITTVGVPVARDAADLNEAGLRRRIAFERLYREYGSPQPDPQVISEAEPNFEKFSKAVETGVAQMRKDLSILPNDPKEQELFVKARELVTQIESIFEQQGEMARHILKNRKEGVGGNNDELMQINVRAQTLLQEKRSQLQDIGSEIALNASAKAKKGEIGVLWSSLFITLLALALGLWGAWVLSRKLARPIMTLLKSTQAVHHGDLGVTIQGLPDDEIGRLGDSLNEMIGELRRKQELQAMISTYIDPRIVEKVILPGRPEVLAGQKQIMTLLFTDLVGFSTISEQLSPTALVKLVNRYLTIMSECIQAEQGIIDKYIGDAIMAYWGPPFISEEDQAAAACRAAIRQRDALTEFRKELPDLLGLRKDLPLIDIRIGLATGEVVVGNIGSDTTRSYTVIGDTVNLASRLESANKEYGTLILISEGTMRMADLKVETREIDQIVVKGKSEPVKVYELLSRQNELSPEWIQRRSRFSDGLAAYRKQDWVAASMIFEELADKYGDKPSKVFMNRISLMEKHALGSGWDGVWRMTQK